MSRPVRTHLVERVGTRDRLALVNSAVIEAARRYVAAHLLAERAAGDDVGETVRVIERDDALQDLRDACSAQGRGRVRR